MLTPAEATRIIAETVAPLPTVAVDFEASGGRILREPICAERDQPPFDRVTMDGIAVSFAGFAAGQRTFAIAHTQHAGDPIQALNDSSTCAEVMTGSVLPPGADTVIPVERITVDADRAHIDADYLPDEGQFVHRQASDHGIDSELLKPGTLIAPADIAIIASCGRAQIKVAATPKVRVVSTGNELVPAGTPIEAHQIRLSNGPALVAMLAQHRFDDAYADHLADEPQLLTQRLGEHLAAADVLILSGGVSMGKADFVPQVLSDLGVEKRFHRVSQRPGKPLWFGRGPQGQAVFALPGNPVSALVCCRHYVVPALYTASGKDSAALRFARLKTALDFAPALTCFMPVRLEVGEDGCRVAVPVPTNTSGDFTALHGTNGYVELAATEQHFAAGAVLPYHAWHAA